MSSRIFRLYVQSDDICLDLLRYIDRHIPDVNAMGVGVHVTRVDEVDDASLDEFSRKGITRLPAMIAPDKTTFVGAKKVRSVFERNISGAGDERPEIGDPAQYETALEALQASEMFAGRDKRGRNIPRKDDEDEDGAAPDYNRRMADFNKKRPGGRRRERDVSPPARGGRRRDDSSEEEPDSASDESPVRNRRPGGRPPRRDEGPATGDPIGDNIDQRMLDELMRGG